MLILLRVVCLGGISIYTFPLVAMLAFFACILTFVVSPKFSILFYNQMITSIAYAMPFAVVFGKLLYALGSALVDQRSFFERFLYGGCVFYGGFIGGAVGIVVYGKLFHESVLDIMDVFACLLPLGQAIGRVGCFLNGCCYGIDYCGLFSVKLDVNGTEKNVFPVWFIESIFCLVLFLLFQKKIENNSGYYTVRYIFSYGAARFFIEFLRGDTIRGYWGLLSTSQIISLALILIVSVFGRKLLASQRKNKIIRGGFENENI